MSPPLFPVVYIEDRAKALERELSKRSDLLRSVSAAGGGEFFQHNGLLYQSLTDGERSSRNFGMRFTGVRFVGLSV
jgi:hypothetical protein